MRTFRLSPWAYRRIALLALLALTFIIVTGGAVRLTGSGLGCPDWPACADGRIVAERSFHPMVEFVNRVITGIVSFAVILAVLGSVIRRPRRRDLILLSTGLVLGIVGQIVLGGETVKHDLAPPYVMGHFLLSLLLVWDATVLHHRAGEDDGPAGGLRGRPGAARPVVPPDLVALARLIVVSAALAIFIGTVVTGAGPHAGDPTARRLDLDVADVARFHGISVMLLLAITVVTLWRLRRVGAPRDAVRRGDVLLATLVAQAAVGYTQYFTGVPPLLVGIHIAGATAVWVAALRFNLGLVRRGGAGPSSPGNAGDTGAPAYARAW
jgi:cytochrome c oxidase assembly protein subunit 15